MEATSFLSIALEAGSKDGHPAEKVVRLAQERNIGLVVTGGSGGEAGREGPGSVTDQILKHCQSAVMVVK